MRRHGQIPSSPCCRDVHGNHSSANDAQKMGTTFDYHPDPCIARRHSAPHPWDPGTPGLRPDPGTPRGTARHRRLRPEPGLPGPPGLAKPQISTISGSGVVGSLSKSRSPYNFSVPEGGPTIADLWLLPARPRQMPRSNCTDFPPRRGIIRSFREVFFKFVFEQNPP